LFNARGQMKSASFKIVDEGVLSRQPGRGAYMPIILPLSDREAIAVQHVGAELASADNHIEILHSHDGCLTWTTSSTIPNSGLESGWCYRGPQIAELPDGCLVMAATRYVADGRPLYDPDTESLQRPEMLLFRSSDRGHSWSAPQIVQVDFPPDRYTAVCSGPLTILSPNRWMYPFETWKPYGFEGPPDQKAGALFSLDQGNSWGEQTIIADDATGRLHYWDQMHAVLPDGRIYNMLWTHFAGTHKDAKNHWSISSDEGRTWTAPEPTNLRGQMCVPIALADGRVAAIYNFRHDPQGIHLALSRDLKQFDTEHELVVFDAGAQTTLGPPAGETFVARKVNIAFGRPGGRRLADGTLLVYYWCTVDGVTQTRWARIQI
jgi:hypothetical protein